MPLFVAKGISKKFGGLQALNNVDVEVNKNEILGMIGPNGAGKSVFVNCVSGYYKPNSGKVILADEDITGKSSHEIFRKGLVRTYQQSRIFYNLPVSRNMKIAHLIPTENGEPEKDEAVLIKEILNEVGLWAKRNVIGNQLTLFEQKKLEIAMKFISKPLLLMLDEPVGGLTAEEISDILDLSRRINKKYNIAIFIIEHTMKAIQTLAHRVVVLSEGEKIASGTCDGVLKDKKVCECYMGSGKYTKRFLGE
ncbi:MAG: ABC transporter ATP-binding protein [Promethearchaeota archaeon]